MARWERSDAHRCCNGAMVQPGAGPTHSTNSPGYFTTGERDDVAGHDEARPSASRALRPRLSEGDAFDQPMILGNKVTCGRGGGLQLSNNGGQCVGISLAD